MTAVRHWGHLLLHVLGLAALLVAADVIVFRHNLRIDLTPGRQFTLSEHSRKILDGLEQRVQVFAFVRPEDPRNVFVRDLLWRANARNPRFTFQLININRNPSLARKYNVDAYGAIVVESRGRQKLFTNMREELLMAAILQVTRDYSKTVYFLTGHGERDIENSDRQRGYSTAKSVLKQEFYEVKNLSLLGDTPVPADATEIVIAGPKSDLFPEEILKLDAYVRRGGALLVLLDPDSSPGLVAFLRRYRFDLPEAVVGDRDYRLAAGEMLTFRVPDRMDSVITSILDSDPVFSYVRPVQEVPGDHETIVVRPVLRTSANSWSMPSPRGAIPDDTNFQSGRDQKGPVNVGMEASITIEKPVDVPDESREGQVIEEIARPTSRVVVYGDSDFANNFFIDLLGNRDLLVNTVNWLALEDQLIGVRPERKASGREQFFLSSRQGYMAFLLGTIVQPAIFLALGIGVAAWRRLR